MGLHINKNFINDNNYKNAVRAELMSFKKLIESVESIKYVKEDVSKNSDKLQALFDITTGKKDSVSYSTGKGWDAEVKFNAIKADKIDLSKIEDDKIYDFLKTMKDDLTAISLESGLLKEDELEESFIDSLEGSFLKTYSGLAKETIDTITDFTNDEIEERNNLINDKRFGIDYLSIDAKERDLGVNFHGNLTNRLKERLEAKTIDDWKNVLSDETITNSVEFYKANKERMYMSNAKFVMGKLIQESLNGKDINDNNVRQCVREVKEVSDEYKNISGFRKFISYINPFKDSVRDLRNEINDAKNFLEMKGIDKDELDNFLNKDASIESVKAPSSRHYLEAVKNTKEALDELGNATGKASPEEKADYLSLTDMVNSVDGKEVNKEETQERINQILNGDNDKWPIDDEVERDMGAMESDLDKTLDHIKFIDSDMTIEDELGDDVNIE